MVGTAWRRGEVGIRTWPPPGFLEANAELVDTQAVLGHVNLATTQIYTHVSEDRMAGVVARL
jgi:integrase